MIFCNLWVLSLMSYVPRASASAKDLSEQLCQGRVVSHMSWRLRSLSTAMRQHDAFASRANTKRTGHCCFHLQEEGKTMQASSA